MESRYGKSLRSRVGLASTISLFLFGSAAAAFFLHKEYRYRLAAVESEIRQSAHFLVPQASMLLIQNDEAASLTLSRVVERIKSEGNFSYVEIVDTQGRVKVPLDTLSDQPGRAARQVRDGPLGTLAMGRDYMIQERSDAEHGKVIEGVFGVMEQDRILGHVVLGASKKPIEEALRKSLLATGLFLSVAMILAIVLSLKFAQIAVKPVERLTRELKIITGTFRKLSRHLRLEDAVKTILEDIVRAIAYCHEAYVILKVNEDGSPAETLTIYPRTLADSKTLLNPSLVESVLAKGELELIQDAGRSYAIYPLYSGSREPLGVLVLTMISDSPLDSDELAALWGVMEPVGMAFDRIFLHAQVERLAVHDSMTGLLNHQNVRERLGEALKVAERQKRTVYIVMADIDKFKTINDTYGHPAGDKVIKAFAGQIQRSLRAGAFAGRYGGEEFLVILGQTDLEGAQNYAERIMKEVRGAAVEIEKGKSVKFTVSMGLAAFPMDGNSLDELVENADEALYAAKEGGRDKFVIFNEEPKKLKII